jgi:uncharacterized MAPEG superfamily protein
MTISLTLVIYMAILTWLLLLVASLVRARFWTIGGMRVALGNRESTPEMTPFAGRCDRTARNTLENFILFSAIVLAVNTAGATSGRIDTGAEIFFFARILYIPVYYLGIPYLRTGIYAVSIGGLGMILSTLWG